MRRTTSRSREVLSRVVEAPAVFDTVQVLAGAAWVDRRLSAALRRLPPSPGRRFLDVGAGTGRAERTVPPGYRYLCLDADVIRIRSWRARTGGTGSGLAADATQVPFRSGSIDVVLCRAIAHHLPGDSLDGFFSECRRVLTPDGRVVLLDPVWSPRRWPGRALWKVDRGAYRRTGSELLEALGRHLDVDTVEHFTVLHAYVLAVARP